MSTQTPGCGSTTDALKRLAEANAVARDRADEAESAWLAYRDDYFRLNPWCDAKRAGRQMRKREFIAGFLAAIKATP